MNFRHLFVTLPWPKPILSPNARGHWREVARERARFRESSRLATLLALNRRRVPATDIQVSLFFTPPRCWAYDQDNLLARIKAGLDGIDDSRFRITRLEILKPRRPPMVEVHLREADAVGLLEPAKKSPRLRVAPTLGGTEAPGHV